MRNLTSSSYLATLATAATPRSSRTHPCQVGLVSVSSGPPKVFLLSTTAQLCPGEDSPWALRPPSGCHRLIILLVAMIRVGEPATNPSYSFPLLYFNLTDAAFGHAGEPLILRNHIHLYPASSASYMYYHALDIFFVPREKSASEQSTLITGYFIVFIACTQKLTPRRRRRIYTQLFT